MSSSFHADVRGGSFEFPRVPANRYWPALEVENRRWLFLGRSVDVRRGQDEERSFFFVRRRLVLRILNSDHQPVRGCSVSLRIREPEELNDWSVWRPEKTDEDGRVVFDPAPPFSVDVRICNQSPAPPNWCGPDVVNSLSTNLGPVSVDSATEKVVDLVLGSKR